MLQNYSFLHICAKYKVLKKGKKFLFCEKVAGKIWFLAKNALPLHQF